MRTFVAMTLAAIAMFVAINPEFVREIRGQTGSDPVMLDALEDQAALVAKTGCVEIIKKYEGVRLEAYQDGPGNWLIGYGHSKEVRSGQTITMQAAEELLRSDIARIEKDIRARLQISVSPAQFSAMTCLAFNVGTGAFGQSTVLKETNNGNFDKAADAFLMWNKMSIDGKLVESEQLTRRRSEERKLYLSQPIRRA